MVKVHVTLHNGSIQSLRIQGHADSAPYGQDLVCAGTSAVAIGLLNALNELAEGCCDLEMNQSIQVTVNQSTETVQNVLQCGLIQLQTLEDQYSKFIQIKKQEV
ncbi:MAG: ribosomal-processing cysteine protease Prp [Erysipelotrichaceae bacterium]|nr:ribosomal-processing cysteine protease Prp [Erysipelotrichaceae bacterium]